MSNFFQTYRRWSIEEAAESYNNPTPDHKYHKPSGGLATHAADMSHEAHDHTSSAEWDNRPQNHEAAAKAHDAAAKAHLEAHAEAPQNKKSYHDHMFNHHEHLANHHREMSRTAAGLNTRRT